MGTFGPVVLTERVGTASVPVMGKAITVLDAETRLPLTPLDASDKTTPITLVSSASGHVPQFHVPDKRAVMLRWGRAGHEIVAALDQAPGMSALVIAGTVPTVEDLPEDAGAGDGYVVADTGHLWVWNGTEWVDAGAFQGPPGADASVTDITVADALTGPSSKAAIGWQVSELLTDSVRRYGAVGNGVDDDSEGLLAALAAGRPMHAPAGDYTVHADERLQMSSFRSLTGDPDGKTRIRFTHPNGGIHLADTLGPGSAYVYGTTLANLNLHGDGTAAKLVTGTNVEEVTFDHVELHDWTDAAVELENASLVMMRECTPGIVPGGESRVGLRLKGICGYVNITDLNAYACTPVEIAGASVAHLNVHGWFEGVRDIVRQVTPGVSSLGIVRVRGRLISTLAQTTIFRYVGGSTLNAELIDWSDMDVYLAASTAPLVDFRAVDNSMGTVNVRGRGAVVYAPNVAHLVGAHADQQWFLLHVDHQDIAGVPASRWWTEEQFAAGGCFPKGIRVTSAGDPNGIVTAPPGSTYLDVGTGEVWQQTTPMQITNTGWAKSLVDRVQSVIKGPTAVQPPTKVANDFGVDLFAVNRSTEEDDNPGAPAMRVNGAGQVRAGWNGTGSNGAFLAQADGALAGLDSLGVVVYTGGALNLRAATATDRVQFVGLLSPSQFATSARPAAASCDGAVIYDTDLHLPIYSNGTAWCRLDGTPL